MFGLSVGVVDWGTAIIVNDDSGIAIERQIFTMDMNSGICYCMVWMVMTPKQNEKRMFWRQKYCYLKKGW